MPVRSESRVKDEIVENPYAVFDRISAAGGTQIDTTGTLYVTDPVLVREVLGDPRFKSRGAAELDPEVESGGDTQAVMGLETFLSHWPVFSDETVQRELIRALRRRFSARSAEALRLTARRAFEEIVARADPAHPLETVAQPIAWQTLRLLLDRPEGDLALLRQYTTSTMSYLMTKGQDPALARVALREIELLQDLVEGWMLSPTSDPILGALAEGGVLTKVAPLDIAALYAQLTTGTLDPTANTLVAGLITVSEDPEAAAFAELRQWEELTEYCLSRETGIHFATRRATCPVHVSGRRIEEGTRVVSIIAAAAREEYERNDPKRAILAFGYGAHYCLGSHTSRVVIQEGLRVASKLTRDSDWVPPVRLRSFGGPMYQSDELFFSGTS